MNRRHRFLVRTVAAAVLAGACGIAGAGSLEPPPGVIKPSMKTLDEVEARRPIHQSDLPMTINVDGAYYLAENVSAPVSGVDMITVLAENVSIDLNGFTINGTGPGGVATDCIEIRQPVRSFSLKDGVIRECGLNGVITNNDGNDLTVSVERVQTILNGESGMAFGFGAAGVISESVSRRNGMRGILLYHGVVQDSVTVENAGVGLQVFAGVIRGCMSKENVIANLFAGGVVADTYAP